MLNCYECNLSFEHVRGLKIHIKREHALSYKEYVIKHVYNNKHPVCACGCGNFVLWRNDSYFMKLLRGHVTQELRDAQSKRRKGTIVSVDTKQKQSLVAKRFWDSEEGKLVATKRAKNLRKFHESEQGKVWAKSRSMKMKAFNATDEGKAIRKSVGRKISEKRNATTITSMSFKLKQFYLSIKGQAFLKVRSEKMKTLYASEEGKALKLRISGKNKIKLLLDRETFEKRLASAFIDLEPITDIPTYDTYVGYRSTFDIPFEVTCKKTQHHDTRKLINILNVPKCLICNRTSSIAQLEIADFIRLTGYNVIFNERSIISPKEIDIFVPDANLAIEFNGLYWHSELNRDNYHVESKRNMLNQKNIKHFVIFEDEWRDKRLLIESMIKSRINQTKESIGARKCELIELSTVDRRKFFNQNHLDGDVKCTKSFGLKYQDEIVAAISLRNPHHKTISNTLEIARYATKINLNVQGGLSKLISCSKLYAQQLGYEKLMSYVDGRIGDGHSYEYAGMSYIRETSQPRFWWTDFVHRYDRFTYKASSDKTQSETATEAGVYKIFGAKNRVYELVI